MKFVIEILDYRLNIPFNKLYIIIIEYVINIIPSIYILYRIYGLN